MEPASALAQAHDLSALGLFLRADPVVKGVMTILLLASIVSWGVIFDRAVRVFHARRAAGRFESLIGQPRAWLSATDGLSRLPAAILAAGDREWRDATEEESRAERRERVERAMRAAMAAELRPLETGLSFLATVGSAAPFVGLLGTVWGIMNSFSAIAGSNETSLAVVAPGIAEALFATAIGLVAAIPAVIGYNKLSVELGRVGRRFTAAIASLGNQMARDPAAANGGAR